ncbi:MULTISPECIES: FecR family protein [Stenotrophomonas]|jgi:transmembrane sensor|uniref:FecR domain-containing protein n=2 Tax=Lysobacteraceae TaxID=32033 RepID=UPI0012926ED1|nr:MULTISPECIES: FecR family protein [Stenotrophomonas]MBD3826120.1 FecR family protein [Stenotrophomonas sp.]
MPSEPAGGDAAIAPEILGQAAEWLLRLHDNDSAGVRRACDQWCAQHPEHARAWQRAQRLQALLGQVPAAAALPVLGRPHGARRRTAIKHLGAWLALAPGAWLAWHLLHPAADSPTLRTAIGERRQARLPDGSRIVLDAGTRLSLHLDARQRTLDLHQGQVLVETTTDTHMPPRPFAVQTSQGRITALGTRFNVRVDTGYTHAALLEGALAIQAGTGPAWRMVAGEQARFDGHGNHLLEALDDTVTSWTTGMRVADAMPLAALLAHLGRYRHGRLRCDPAIATLPVSGAFPLDDTERSLAMLEATYPVRVRRAPGGWWVLIEPR